MSRKRERDEEEVGQQEAGEPSKKPCVNSAGIDEELRVASWQAAHDNPESLDKLLENPLVVWEKVNWNAAGVCPGTTLAWTAAFLARRKRLGLLAKLLKQSAAFETLHWNAGPQDKKDQNCGMTLVWMAADLAILDLSRDAWEEEEFLSLLLEALLKCRDVVAKLDWNVAPQNGKNADRGVTLAWLAAYLAVKYKGNLLDELLTRPDALDELNWNVAPQAKDDKYCGVTLALIAAELAIDRAFPDPRLLAELLKRPDAVAKLNWNAKYENKEIGWNYGLTLAWRAAQLALGGQSGLLQELLKSSDQVAIVDWHAAHLSQSAYADDEETVVDKLAKLFTQDFQQWEPFITKLKRPGLERLQLALADKPTHQLSVYVNFLLSLTTLEEKPAVSGLDDAKDTFSEQQIVLQTFRSHSVYLHDRACLHFAKKFPERLEDYYQQIKWNSTHYGEAQEELASAYFAAGDSKEIPSAREIRLTAAFHHACYSAYQQTQEQVDKVTPAPIKHLLARILGAYVGEYSETDLNLKLSHHFQSKLDFFVKNLHDSTNLPTLINAVDILLLKCPFGSMVKPKPDDRYRLFSKEPVSSTSPSVIEPQSQPYYD